MPGAENTYQSYGKAWANLSNTPFRLYKHWVHEGGIATPFIMHWPRGIQDKNAIRHTPAQLPDVMATILEVTGAAYPETYNGNRILPLEGTSLVPLFTGENDSRGPLFFEHEGNACIREGHWKLVRNYPQPWELYHMEEDRTETNDLAALYPERVKEMADRYEAWAKRSRVVPREKILELMKQIETVAFWEEDS